MIGIIVHILVVTNAIRENLPIIIINTPSYSLSPKLIRIVDYSET
jgi:hypothetical protein